MVSFEQTDTHHKVIDLIKQELNVEGKDISEQTTLNALGADSLDMVEIIMKLEEQFGLEISDEDAEGFKTVHDIIVYVHKRRTK